MTKDKEGIPSDQQGLILPEKQLEAEQTLTLSDKEDQGVCRFLLKHLLRKLSLWK